MKHRDTSPSVMQWEENYNPNWSGAGTGGSMKDFINSSCMLGQAGQFAQGV